MEGTDFEDYCTKKSSCIQPDGENFVLKREHPYYYQVQQQLHITKRTVISLFLPPQEMVQILLRKEFYLIQNTGLFR